MTSLFDINYVGVDEQSPRVDGERPPDQDEVTVLQAELDGLRQRLKTLPVIEQSKGLLIGYYGVDADRAFAILRRWSSHTNLKLRDISQQLVSAASRPGRDGSPGSGLDDVIRHLNERSHNFPPFGPTSGRGTMDMTGLTPDRR